MDNYSEMWDEFCFLLSGKSSASLSEKDFENQVVRAIEVLGWREFKKEIERQPIVQMGREGTLRPDLIIYGDDRRVLFVVEVKRPSENILRDNIIGQLRSYMRQMKSDFGFLIGSDLRIYYDGSSNPNPDPLLLERIDIDRASKEGINFIQLFNKKSFLNKEYHEYLEEKIRKFNKKREVKLMIDRILLFETKQKLIGFLRNEFPDVGDDTFSEAMEQININIVPKKDSIETPIAELERERSPRRETIRPHQVANPGGLHFNNVSTIPFENRAVTKLRQIYGVLSFMKQGLDFPSAIHETLKLFPEVQDYQTISDKCGRGFAGNVDNFISWFNTGEMLNKLSEKLSLSKPDYNIFSQLLFTKTKQST